MWIFLVEFVGIAVALGGWYGFQSFGALLAGSVLIAVFDILMFSSGGQLKHPGLSIFLLAAGGITGAITGSGILVTALLFFSVYSAVFLILKLILLLLAAFDHE